MVYLLKYRDNELKVSYLGCDDKEMAKLVVAMKKIVTVKELKDKDETDYLINPSKKQFKKLIDTGLFQDAYKFRKIR